MIHANIAIFVPHNGCPHQCSFCNQKNITGVSYQPVKEDVVQAVNISLKTSPKVDCREVAFFGGSFTAIPRGYMIELLEAVQPYIDSGCVKGIRISTRPDAINSDILDLLKRYNVTAIELGAQSMDNEVLSLNERGHTSEDVFKASNMIKNYGFELGLQMMVGLYGSSKEKDIITGELFSKITPNTVRIYPTLIMNGTKLADLYNDGVYIPLSFDETVEVCAELLKIFERNNINVIRLGLHSSESLEDNLIAGVWHPAFREICEGKILIDKFMNIASKINKKELEVHINPKDISKFIGNKKCNIKKLHKLGFEIKIKQDINVNKNSVYIEGQK